MRTPKPPPVVQRQGCCCARCGMCPWLARLLVSERGLGCCAVALAWGRCAGCLETLRPGAPVYVLMPAVWALRMVASFLCLSRFYFGGSESRFADLLALLEMSACGPPDGGSSNGIELGSSGGGGSGTAAE